MSTAPGTLEAPAPTVDELLAPISGGEAGDDPVGESLRYDVIHDEIRELRRADDPTLPQGVWRHELKRADWRGLARITSEALRDRSKDLQMAVWLVEAWARLDRLEGLARGLALLTGLIERWGASLHPRPDADDPEPNDPALRNAALGRLESCLPEALQRLPLTRPRGERGEGAEVHTWGDWQRALYLENLGANHPEAAAAAGGVSRERFLASVGLTPDGFYPAIAARAEVCGAALGRLAALADETYGRDAPAFRAVRDELEAVTRLARRLTTERGEVAEVVPPAPEAADAARMEETEMSDPPETPLSGSSAEGADAARFEAAPAAGASIGPITTRAEAYRALDQAAELLLRVEPHSPVPYLVKRAVRWGGLSLSELYGELFQIADPNVVFRLLGIQKETEE